MYFLAAFFAAVLSSIPRQAYTEKASLCTKSPRSTVGMDMTSMCNINLMYFAVAVYVRLFVSEDFRNGYAKNLFPSGRKEKNTWHPKQWWASSAVA